MGIENLLGSADTYTSFSEVAGATGTVNDQVVASTPASVIFTIGISVGMSVTETYFHAC
ncbi:hypothetical protein GCM10009558_105860 [Virgisporangium aurantiacum]